MGRLRGSLKKSKMKTGLKTKSKNGVKTKSRGKTKKFDKPRRSARRQRDEDEDEDDDRGRFGPPPRQSSSGAVLIIVGVVAALVLFVAMTAGGGGTSIVDEHEAEKAFMKVDGNYALAKGGDALTENRVALRNAFQSVADAFPGTEAGEKALRRVKELQ